MTKATSEKSKVADKRGNSRTVVTPPKRSARLADDRELLAFPRISQPAPIVSRKYDPQRAFRDKQRRLYAMLRREDEFADSANADSLDDGGEQRKLLPPPIPRQFIISDTRNCGYSNVKQHLNDVGNNHNDDNNNANDDDNDSYDSSDSDSDSDIDGHIYGDSDYGDDDAANDFNDYINYDNDEYDCVVTDGECLANKQARDLTHFLSDPEETIRLPNRERIGQFGRQKRRRVRRGFFNIPGEVEVVRCQTEEQTSSDWVVVSIELERTASCDSLLDENLCQLIQNAADSRDPAPVTVDVEQPPTVVDASNDRRPNIDEDYGLIYARNRHIRRLLRLFKFLDFDIRFGKPLDADQTAPVYKPSLTSRIHAGISRAKAQRRKRRRDARIQRINNRNSCLTDEQQPCCSTTMHMKTDKLAEALFTHPHLTMASEKTNESDPFCIAKHFGLNDDGDIILHLDHIVEHKGYGFLMRRKQRIYRRTDFGCEISEKVPFSVRTVFRNVVKTICGGELDDPFFIFCYIYLFVFFELCKMWPGGRLETHARAPDPLRCVQRVKRTHCIHACDSSSDAIETKQSTVVKSVWEERKRREIVYSAYLTQFQLSAIVQFWHQYFNLHFIDFKCHNWLFGKIGLWRTVSEFVVLFSIRVQSNLSSIVEPIFRAR